MSDGSFYRLLQVDPGAEPDVIAAAYRTLAARLHPDRDFTGVDEFRMRELNEAYAVLRDPEQRRAYDQQLESETRVPMGPGLHSEGGLAGRIHARDANALAEVRLDFGRYVGWALGELMRTDPDYLRWLSRHSSGIRYRGAILKLFAAQETERTPLRVP